MSNILSTAPPIDRLLKGLKPALKSKVGDIKYSSVPVLQILTFTPNPRVASFKKPPEAAQALVVSVASGVP